MYHKTFGNMKHLKEHVATQREKSGHYELLDDIEVKTMQFLKVVLSKNETLKEKKSVVIYRVWRVNLNTTLIEL